MTIVRKKSCEGNLPERKILFRALQPKISSKLMKQYVADVKSYVNLSMSYKRRHIKKEIIK